MKQHNFCYEVILLSCEIIVYHDFIFIYSSNHYLLIYFFSLLINFLYFDRNNKNGIATIHSI